MEELSAALEKRVQEFTLPNGLTFLVLERRLAPIVSCHTYADVGAFDEDAGQTGIAHLLEHMAFKGSQRIGTQDFSREAPLLDALDEGAAPGIGIRDPALQASGIACRTAAETGIMLNRHVRRSTPAHDPTPWALTCSLCKRRQQTQRQPQPCSPCQPQLYGLQQPLQQHAATRRHARAVFYALRDARRVGAEAEASRLDAELRRLTAAAGALEEANAFGALLQRAGAVGLNATTSHDATKCGLLRSLRGTVPRSMAAHRRRHHACTEGQARMRSGTPAVTLLAGGTSLALATHPTGTGQLRF